MAEPLNSLLQEGVLFQFAANEQRAFQQLKDAFLQSPFLAFFDTNALVHTILTTDASGTGVGAMLSQVQDGIEKPVCFISRKLHPNETKFSSSELETLTVVWAVERLHQTSTAEHLKLGLITQHCGKFWLVNKATQCHQHA